jgi:hypothetical protein
MGVTSARRFADRRLSRQGQQISHPNHVGSCCGEGKHPSDFVGSFKMRLALQRDQPHPVEHFFYAFSVALADGIARVGSGARINAAAPARVVLRYVRCRICSTESRAHTHTLATATNLIRHGDSPHPVRQCRSLGSRACSPPNHGDSRSTHGPSNTAWLRLLASS